MDNPKHSRVDFEELKDKCIKFTNKHKDNVFKSLNEFKNNCNKLLDKIKNKHKDIEKNKIKIKNKRIINSKIKEKTQEEPIHKEFNLKNIHIRLALSALMIFLMVGLGITAYKINLVRTEAYHVYLGKEEVGTIRNKDEALVVVEELKDELCNEYSMDVAINDKIKFEETHVKDDLLTSSGDLKNNIKSKVDFQVYGYLLTVDGEEMGALKTKEEIEDILNRIKEPYQNKIEEDKTLKEIRFVEDIKIEKKKMQINDIGKSEEIYEALLTSSEQIRTHVVEVGESFWAISMFYEMTVDELIEANPEKNPNALKIGDEIRLVIPKPVVTVATAAEVEYIEDIKYETEVEYDDNMYNTQTKTKVAGVKGSAKILANEIKHNGFYIDKEIVKEEILEEPVKEIIVKGTKEPPKTMATGTLLMPTRGKISSRYGMRRGKMHRGLDIASRTGTDIKAADGGKVVFTGYKGSYGNLIEINHENGYKTRYAHNSKILVKTGDRVYKGQVIGKMGSTGRSTGSHLHFEVLVNNKNKNPSNFVK